MQKENQYSRDHTGTVKSSKAMINQESIRLPTPLSPLIIRPSAQETSTTGRIKDQEPLAPTFRNPARHRSGSPGR